MEFGARSRRTVAEWERRVGEQVRDLRVRAGLTQSDLARRANVSVGAVQSLEYGNGTRLATLIAVLRVLGRVEVLDHVAPEVTVSPLQLLAEQRDRDTAPARRVRVRGAAGPSRGEGSAAR